MIDERFSAIEGIEYMNSYDKMLNALDATVEEPMEYNTILYNFEYLHRVHNMNDAQLDYIAELIVKGYDAFDVLEVCFFWLGTSEDIGIIEEMYKLKGRYKGVSTWVENAFNYVTDNKCGVLDEEGVAEYLSKGVSLEDIYAANVLCRKGVYTIQEILDMIIEGKTFAEVTAMVNGIPVVKLPAEALEKTAINSVAEYETDKEQFMPEVDTGAKYTDTIAPGDVIIADQLTRIDGGEFSVYLNRSVSGEDLSNILDEAEAATGAEISKDLRERGVYKTASHEDKVLYEEMMKEEAE